VSPAGTVASPLLENSGARFRAARRVDWERLETLLDRIEKRSASALSNEDLFELPVLYRATLSSLSVARETSLDADLVAYLEALSTRAYFILYGVHAPLHTRIARFFARDWPEAVRGLWRETLVSVAITLVGAIAGYFLVLADPAWFYAIVDGGYAAGRDPSSSAEALREALHGEAGNGLAVFAAYLFTHNAQIAIMCFALGFAFAAPTILLLIQNGCVLGAFFAVYGPKGLGLELAAWLSVHGTTELFAIILAGGAGMRIGMAVAFPGRRTRLQSAVQAGRSAALVMLGVVVMLVVAGSLEAFVRQLVSNDIARATIGATMLLFWLAYFYLPRRSGVDHG